MKNGLWTTMTDLENVGIELESLATLLSYLLSDLSDGAETGSDDPMKALCFAERTKTFCAMLFAVHTGIETQIKALERKIEEGYEAIKQEGKK